MSRPEKAPGGLHKVIYIRAAPELVREIDALTLVERKQYPGRSISRSDIVREILVAAISERARKAAR